MESGAVPGTAVPRRGRSANAFLELLHSWFEEHGFSVDDARVDKEDGVGELAQADEEPRVTLQEYLTLASFCDCHRLVRCQDCGSARVECSIGHHDVEATPVVSQISGPAIISPESVRRATPAELRQISATEREVLIAALTPADLAALSSYQLAVINPARMVVPFKGDPTPHTPQARRAATFKDDKGVHRYLYQLPAQHRWYVIVRGVGFTGVVRGSRLFDTYGRSVPGAGAASFREVREEAEEEWLAAFYERKCGTYDVFMQTTVPVVPQ